MNRERAKELLPIIEAFADGEAIQMKVGTQWMDKGRPDFLLVNQFRIKPEPREFWISNKNIPTDVSGFGCEVYITTCAHDFNGWIKVREIL